MASCGHSLIPRPRPKKWEEGLVTLAPYPVNAESAVLILNRSITFVHFPITVPIAKFHKVWQTVCRGKMDVVAIPRRALEVTVGEINAAIGGAVTRLSTSVLTTEQKDAVTAFVGRKKCFCLLVVNHCATCACRCLTPQPKSCRHAKPSVIVRTVIITVSYITH